MTTPRLKPREQGDLGELSAMEWLAGEGAKIYIPVFHSPDVDLIAQFEGSPVRVQVKTSTVRNKRELEWTREVSGSISLRLSLRTCR